MEIIWDKTIESCLLFRRPLFSVRDFTAQYKSMLGYINLNQSLLPDQVCNIDQVLEARLLGVIISGKFAFHSHVKYLHSVGI